MSRPTIPVPASAVTPESGRRGNGVGDAATPSEASLFAAVDHISAMLRTGVRANPYLTLGIAAGLGVLVGGGMWRLFARSILGLGTRLAVSTAVSTLIDHLLPRDTKEQST